MDENSLEGIHSQHLEPERGEGLTKEYLDAKIISFFLVILIAVIPPLKRNTWTQKICSGEFHVMCRKLLVACHHFV